MGGGDLHALAADRRGHVMQQPRPVAAIHFDDGVGIARVVVDDDPRRHRHRAQPRRLPPHLPDLIGQAQTARERLLDKHRKPRQAMRLVEGGTRGILHPKCVQRRAIGHGVDARIHDRRTSDRERTRDTAEQAGMVGAIDRHLGHAARFQHAGAHGQRRLAIRRLTHHRRMAGVGLRVEAEPVAGVAEAQEVIHLRLRPALQQRRHRILRTSHAHVALGH